MVAGLLIVVLGTILLLDRLGLLHGWDVLRHWPVLLILAGLARLLAPRNGVRRVWGAFGATAGVLLELKRLGLVRLNWDAIYPLFIIAIGLMLVWRAFLGRRPAGEHTGGSPSVLHEWVVFGGHKLHNNTQDFRGGELFSLFGGYEIDLSKADMQPGEATLNVTALFGGAEIRVPEGWNVVLHGTPILGGFEDKTYHPKPDPNGGEKRLIVNGFAAFGGVEIKN